ASAAFAGLFAFFEACKNRYRWLGILALVLAVLIAISRVIELDHYPSDVIFGAYVGILSVYYVQFFMGKRWQ
ncbi:MAG: phosphatase PAP2 family protein, partial [Gammaproteobacteria bacterium]|nr:phosphatase PAP2 family protein [Gammaproteobacteria bacterium]